MGRNSDGVLVSDLIKISVATLISGKHMYWEEYCKREEVRKGKRQ